jgi:hypothetical protein
LDVSDFRKFRSLYLYKSGTGAKPSKDNQKSEKKVYQEGSAINGGTTFLKSFLVIKAD